MVGHIDKNEVAECVGLWLAEGDNKSKSELTFTNSCLELVNLFYKVTNELFSHHNYNKRIYVYTKDGSKIDLPYKDCKINYYRHSRATRPYFIFRIASVKIMIEWKNLIEESLRDKGAYPYILRGFFAGEGNVHTGKRSVRVLRISQAHKKDFIDNLLNEFGLKFSFYKDNRNYVLSGRKNWEIFANLRLADLHPLKKEKFWRTYNSFKEYHYEKNYLSNTLPSLLHEQLTTKDLSIKLNRSPARICEVLIDLKKEGKVKNFRVKNVDYWINNKNLIIISRLKEKYLDFLISERMTSEFAKYFKVNWKSSFRRLKELEKLGLVKQQENGKWIKQQTIKDILVI